MKLKEKAKRFFTMNAANHEGFTLVELIVVIAILAILAGVAVPAYSGYIKKAEKAGDMQLLGAVNEAFAAACMAEGVKVLNSEDASMPIVSGKIVLENVQPAEVAASFAQFYKGNEESKFKVITELVYNPADGVFVELTEDVIIENLKAVISGSNYAGKLVELTGDVSGLVTSLKNYLDTDLASNITGSGFGTYMTDVLGLGEEPSTQEMANAAVLYMGYTAANMSDEEVENAKLNVATQIATMAASLSDTDTANDTLDLGACGSLVEGSQLASYAALYAAAEAIALSEQANGNNAPMDALNPENLTNPQAVIDAVSNAFKAAGSDALLNYVTPTNEEDYNTMSAYKDLDAYFETLKAVNGKEDELKSELSTTDLYTTNSTVLDLLAQLQG